MKRIPIILAVILATMYTLPSFGWGQKGHDIIAYIAEQNLTCRAKKKITKILDGKSIVYYSSWMDNLQNSPEWKGGYDVTKTWHYANVDEGETYDSMRKEERGDVLTALDKIVSGLRKGELSDSLESDYLKMLVHLVGDLHCPMHAGRLSDRGGNNFKVKWFGQQTNIHSVWDSRFIESARKWSYREWQSQLDRLNRKERNIIAYGTPRQWFDETVGFAAYIYSNTPENGELSYQYVYDNSELLERQLLYGGYRLAALLNDIFG